MRFATLPNGTPDGRLHLISRDNARAVPAKAATTLQAALEAWEELAPALEAEYAALNAGRAEGSVAFDPAKALAPLPRAWQWLDGSAYDSHGELMKQLVGFDAKQGLDILLMYQGISDRFLSPTETALFPSEADGIDFEGEFGVITDAVPMGVTAEAGARHIRLVVQINDWSLRGMAAVEMKSGFGVLRCKPRCSMAPVAVTPDELGPHWRDGQVDLPLEVDFRGARFGAANGHAMCKGFGDHVAHAAYSRDLVAGTVIGSGTVSNADFREVGSSCIAERRGIETLDLGAPKTPFMAFGERVRMEAKLPDGRPLFGAIDQAVAKG